MPLEFTHYAILIRGMAAFQRLIAWFTVSAALSRYINIDRYTDRYTL